MPSNFFFLRCQKDDIYRVWIRNTFEILKVEFQVMSAPKMWLWHLQGNMLFHVQIIVDFSSEFDLNWITSPLPAHNPYNITFTPQKTHSSDILCNNVHFNFDSMPSLLQFWLRQHCQNLLLCIHCYNKSINHFYWGMWLNNPVNQRDYKRECCVKLLLPAIYSRIGW